MEEQEIFRRIVAEAVCEIMEKKAGGERSAISLCEEKHAQQREKNDMEKPEKPEHMTHLRGDHLVYKDHPRIAFRGAIDSLESEIILLQTITQRRHMPQLTEDLEEIIGVIRKLLRCEVSGEAVGEMRIQGMDTDMIRAQSHHPSQYFGMKHFLPTYKHGEIVAYLNRLRTRARETELTAYCAFRMETGDVERGDIIRILNRLSSLFWIMMFKVLTGRYGGGYEN